MATSDGRSSSQGGDVLSELADKAHDEFEADNYAAAVRTLQRLQNERPGDGKVMHNMAIAKFWTSPTKDFSTLLNDLLQAKLQMNNGDTSSNSEEDEAGDQTEMAVISYNIGVILTQTRKYREALQCFEEAFQFVDGLDELVGRRIAYALLEMRLMFHQSEKAGQVIAYLDKFQSKRSSKSQEGENSSETSSPTPLDPEDATRSFFIHHFKAQTYCLGKPKLCRREIKSALSITNQSPGALYLKSKCEMLRKNFRKAIKVLLTCPKGQSLTNGQALSTMFFNDLGCTHLQTKKCGLATYYFSQAYKEFVVKGTPTSNQTFALEPPDRRLDIVHNQGLSLLLSGKPELAHDCFQASLEIMPHNPRIWLRLGESCLLAQCPSTTQQLFHHIGAGIFRKMVVNLEGYPTKNSARKSDLSASNALRYLRNAKHLLESVADSSPKDGNHVLPGTVLSPVLSSEIPELLASISANIAYAALCVGDTQLALKEATELLQLDGSHRLCFHGHLYAGEALLLEGKHAEALEHLSLDQIQMLSRTVSEQDSGEGTQPFKQHIDSDSGVEKHFTATVAPKAEMLLNITAAHCYAGNLDRASSSLGEASNSIAGWAQTKRALLLSLYIDVRRGKAERALTTLRTRSLPFQTTSV